MSKIATEVLIVVLLIAVNGLFSMAEIAVVSARKTRLQQQADEGNRNAQTALALANAPNQFLAMIQVGITLVGILAGAFGGATIAEWLEGALQKFPTLAPYAEAIGVAVVVLTITYLTLVFGELVPKRLGLSNPEGVAGRFAPYMRILSRLASPLVRILGFSTDLVLRLFRVSPGEEVPVSEEEIKLLLRQGTGAGVFEPAEEQMVGQVFRLTDATLKVLMTPRGEVIWLDPDDPAEETRRTIVTHGRSCFPVARGDLDHVLGTVSAKALLANGLAGRPLDLSAHLRPALFLPESITALEAVEQMKRNRAETVLVIDEYGGVEGLVTADDILRAIVGDVPVPGKTFESEAIHQSDGSWLLDGRLPVDDVKRLLSIDSLPHEDEDQVETLGGLVMLCLERIPSVGDSFDCGGWRFEVTEMERHRVAHVQAVPRPNKQEQP
jgi:putative hemolysin